MRKSDDLISQDAAVIPPQQEGDAVTTDALRKQLEKIVREAVSVIRDQRRLTFLFGR